MNRKLLNIPVDMIDEPAWAIRTVIIRENLEELVNSIKQVGILQPLLLKQKNNRYEIIVGNRRFLAAVEAGLASVPALVVDLPEKDQITAMGHENIFREDVNPVDQAKYLQYLIDTFGYDRGQLAVSFGRSLPWVSAMLDILTYPEEVKAAVEAVQIAYVTGGLLAKIEDDKDRKYYLNEAVETKASVKTVTAWYLQYVALKAGRPLPMGPPVTNIENQDHPIYAANCTLCKQKFPLTRIINVSFCSECYRTFRQAAKMMEEGGFVEPGKVDYFTEGKIPEGSTAGMESKETAGK